MRDIDELRALGMKRPIARRDFLNGIGITGAYATLCGLPSLAKAAPENVDAASYPPLRTGLRGHYPVAVEEFARIHNGKYAEFPVSREHLQE